VPFILPHSVHNNPLEKTIANILRCFFTTNPDPWSTGCVRDSARSPLFTYRL